MPHLRALGMRNTEWDPEFMGDRAEVLLRLAYARLKDWLGLTWSEATTDPVVHVADDAGIDGDELQDEVAAAE